MTKRPFIKEINSFPLTETKGFNGKYVFSDKTDYTIPITIRQNPKNRGVSFIKLKPEDLKNLICSFTGEPITKEHIEHNEFAIYNYQIKWILTSPLSEEWLELYDKNLPQIEWIIRNYFPSAIDQMKKLREDNNWYALSYRILDMWFWLPDSIFNIRVNPPGWNAFLELIDKKPI